MWIIKQTTDQPTTQQYSIMAATGMKNNNIQGALNVQPPHSVFQIDANGSQNKHEIINTTDKRHAFKVGSFMFFSFCFYIPQKFQVKSSNNDFYRVSIVYGFVEPQAKVSLNIHRQPGGKAQPDKLV